MSRIIFWPVLIVVLSAGLNVVLANDQPAAGAPRLVTFQKLFPALARLAETNDVPVDNLLHNINPRFDKTYFINRTALVFADSSGRKLGQFDFIAAGFRRFGHRAWNPAGERLAVGLNTGEATPLYMLDSDGAASLLIPVRNGDMVLQPHWSFDGEWIAYLISSRSAGHTIEILNLQTKEKIQIERLPVGAGVCGNPVWFNNTHRLLYRIARLVPQGEKRVDELWLFDLAARTKKKIYTGSISTTFPIISPDDSLIGAKTGPVFRLLDAGGTTIKTLNTGSTLDAAWSPDGTKIAYINPKIEPGTEKSLEAHLYVCHVASGKAVDLTPAPGFKVTEFKWVDNETIVYLDSSQ